MTEVDNRTAQEEGRYHDYTGKSIPWWVRLIWVLFWSFAAYYVVSFLVPALRSELLSPP
jgi:hypothetical protein